MANSWMDQILKYENSGAIRNKPVSSELETAIRNGVLAVYGDGYTVDIISGGQGGGRTTGSRRHTTGGAADVYIKDPKGNRITGDALIPMAQHWRSQNLGGVGFPAKTNQSMHLDLIGGSGAGAIPLGPGEGMTWFYGTPTAAQREAILAGKAPKYALSYDQIVKGLLPPESLKGVGTQLDTVADLTLRTGAPIPRHPSIAARARAEMAARAPIPAPRSDSEKARRREELKGGTSLAGMESIGDFVLKADRKAPGQSQIERNPTTASVPQSTIERNKPRSIPGQSSIERNPGMGVTAKRSVPGQSNIERNPPSREKTLGTLTPTNTPGVSRISGPNQAGQVAMPRDVRPNVTVPNLDRIAETLPGGSNPKAIPGFTFAGQENAKPSGKSAPKVGLSTPLSPVQSAIERTKPRDVTVAIASQQQEAAKGKRNAAAATAQASQDKMPVNQDKPLNSPKSATAVTAESADEFNLMSSLGFDKDMQDGVFSVLNGLTDLFGGDSSQNRRSASRSPLSSSQIAEANRNSQNHNSAALAAINRGDRSYTSGDGSVQPTTAMNGNVRNTYGD